VEEAYGRMEAVEEVATMYATVGLVDEFRAPVPPFE
jgi:hypothetical protein